MKLVYWEIGAWMAGEERPPCEVIRSLGITYSSSQANPIADNWFFYDVDNLPESLPDYIEIK
ncbi:hypothetical protein A9G13_02085 [Gilliamella sp. wkB178]|nr:hypothetical protein A9G13_02085 [Gilliamella apicola]